ncbi:MAG TPA: hypothetical protein VK828_00300 [Terriglobales bacterium]|nr:hypothetical protein [Terriglobales bacterium]
MSTILLAPAYGQQEVDPTWYDPTPNTAITQAAQSAGAAHSSQSAVTVHAQTAAAKSPSTTQNAAKSHAKDKQFNQNRNDAARKSVGTPAARNEQPSALDHARLQARNAEVGLSIYRSPDDPITR